MTRRALRPVVEVGFGSGPADPEPDWVDITDRVWGAGSGPELGVQRGRSGERAQLQPGSCTFVLDNTEGVFDPDNAEGPFFGLLVDGVPIRVRAASSDTTEDVWRGWVEAWPQTDSRSQRTVEVDCLDVVGLMAQGDAPATAFEAEVLALPEPPDSWWAAGPVGWMDNITGTAARHTGGLVEMDALVDGDGRSWGQTDPDGFGATTARVPDADGDHAWTVVSALVRFPTDRLVDSVLNQRMPTVVCWQPVWYSGVQFDRLLVTVFDGHLSAGMTSRDFESGVRTSAAWSTAEDSGTPSVVNLFDGERHHLMVAMRAGHPNWTVAHAWVDGRRLDLPLVHWSQGEGAPPVHGDNAQLRIGVGAGTSAYNGTPYQGQIDHLMIWANFVGDVDDLDSMAVTLHRAGRLAWAGQRLDERLERIATGMNVDGLLGELDTSGIVTGHGYRSGNPLELLQKIEDTEQGRIWVDRHGQLQFANRRWPTKPESAVVQAWFSDNAVDLNNGALPMSADRLSMAKDPRRTTNVAQVTSEHGRMQTVEDRDSIAVRGRRNPVHLSGLMHASDRQSRAIAQFIVATSSEPAWRVDSLTFRAEDHPDLAVLAQQIEEGWLVKVTRAGREVLGHVTSIHHHVDQWGWQVAISLDSTRAGQAFWRADLSTTDGPDVAGF